MVLTGKKNCNQSKQNMQYVISLFSTNELPVLHQLKAETLTPLLSIKKA